jgi:hypothetical protein
VRKLLTDLFPKRFLRSTKAGLILQGQGKLLIPITSIIEDTYPYLLQASMEVSVINILKVLSFCSASLYGTTTSQQEQKFTLLLKLSAMSLSLVSLHMHIRRCVR